MKEFELLGRPDAASEFRQMTFPLYQRLLAFEPGRVIPLAVAARSAGKPAGLALTSPVVAGQAQLLSVFVEKGARRQGLGTELVQRAAAECAARGATRLVATYMISEPGTAPVERFFANAGWSEPQARMLVVHCSSDSIGLAPWMTQQRQLPTGYDILSWVDATAAEREEIRQSNAREPWIPADLNPFDFEYGIEPITSVALRVNGKILGWCLNHVVYDKLRYSCSFVRRDLQGLGRILALYKETVTRAPRAGMSVGTWAVPVAHARMANFARRHLRPYSIFFGETRGVEKQLVGAVRD